MSSPLRNPSGLVIVVIAILFASAAADARTIGFASPNTFPSVITNPGCVAIGDFNEDGSLDLAVTDHFNSVAVFLGKGDGKFAAPTLYTLTMYVQGCAAVGDFNGDHKPDLVAVGSSVALLIGKGDGTFKSPMYFTTTLGGSSLFPAVGDLNNDHNPDVFIGGNGSSGEIFGDSNGGFSEGQPQPASGFSVSVGDFNGDGNLDVASTSPFTNSVAILLGNGDGNFQTPTVYSGINEPLGITTADFNHDNKLDLAVTVYNGGAVLILLGNGDGTFSSGATYFAGNSPGTVISADFNKDGNPDLATSNFGGGDVSVLSGNGDGSFVSATNFVTGNNPAYLAAGDFNQDGSEDLAVTNYADSTVSILLNAAGTRVSLRGNHHGSKVGQRVVFTVVVGGTITTSLAPTGRVIFMDGSTSLGIVPLKHGRAEFRTSGLTQGTHHVMALYAGDTTFNPNTSSVLVQTVH